MNFASLVAKKIINSVLNYKYYERIKIKKEKIFFSNFKYKFQF